MTEFPNEVEVNVVYQFGNTLILLDLADEVECVYKRIEFKPGWHYNKPVSVEIR